jgi:hypothetical protein
MRVGKSAQFAAAPRRVVDVRAVRVAGVVGEAVMLHGRHLSHQDRLELSPPRRIAGGRLADAGAHSYSARETSRNAEQGTQAEEPANELNAPISLPCGGSTTSLLRVVNAETRRFQRVSVMGAAGFEPATSRV